MQKANSHIASDTYNDNSIFVLFFLSVLGAVTILYAVKTTQTIDLFIRMISEVNSQMTSAERALAYTRIQSEQDFPETPPENWPNAGEIEMKNVSL